MRGKSVIRHVNLTYPYAYDVVQFMIWEHERKEAEKLIPESAKNLNICPCACTMYEINFKSDIGKPSCSRREEKKNIEFWVFYYYFFPLSDRFSLSPSARIHDDDSTYCFVHFIRDHYFPWNSIGVQEFRPENSVEPGCVALVLCVLMRNINYFINSDDSPTIFPNYYL